MALDAGMLSAIVNELNATILNAKVEKIYQPEKDMLILSLHIGRSTYKLLISASANNPRVNITKINYENPQAPPMFCMLLRKHLTGSKIIEISQLGFERAVKIVFKAYDELGFECERHLIIEIMGKHSNIIFLNQDGKILNAIKIIDITTSQKRQILPGMIYENPPSQDKISPLDITEFNFIGLFERSVWFSNPESFILNTFMGISKLIAREIVYQAGIGCGSESLWRSFNNYRATLTDRQFTPVIVKDLNGKPIEYSFTMINQYANKAVTEKRESFGELIDDYYITRDKIERNKQHAADIFKLLSNTEARLLKKIQLQKQDIKDCEQKDLYKAQADLITSNMYKLKKGMTKVNVTNYYSEEMEEVEIELDSRLTPSQNAQKLYKKFTKAKTAEVELQKQIKISEGEIEYINTIFDALTRAELESDYNEIRHELYEAGYASRMKNYTVKKMKPSKPIKFKSENGYAIYCGKNNLQNDNLSLKFAEKTDYWFHTKSIPGSHVIMICGGEEPAEIDFTQAAMIAAYHSKASEGVNVPVDYTLVKNLKKPFGSKPGFVVYHTNWTAYVTPNKEIIEKLKDEN